LRRAFFLGSDGIVDGHHIFRDLHGAIVPPREDQMKKFIALLLCIAFPGIAVASDNGYKIAYDGGSLPNAKAGTEMRLYIEGGNVRITRNKADVVVVPAAAITEISYGQDVHRRVGAAIGVAVVSLGIGALLALSKSKKHFVGITWDDGGKKGGIAFQADKNDYRGLLTGLEGITGKKAVDSDAMNVKN
jgi:hypothetical protein